MGNGPHAALIPIELRNPGREGPEGEASRAAGPFPGPQAPGTARIL
jgi:hypothetical protein